MDKPVWAQNPVQHDPTHHRVSDSEMHRKICAQDAKEAHGWSKPEWAATGTVTTKAVQIDNTPIPMPMLKKTAQSEAMLVGKTMSEEEQAALQARLAAARKGASGSSDEAPVDPTANMTPEEKAKYIADQRLIAIREQTEARELAAWKANQEEVRAIEKERREAAKAQALAQKKEREAQEKKDREKKQQAMKQEQEAQKAKEVELLQQQIEALKAQLGEGPASPGASEPQPSPVAAPVVRSPTAKDKHKWAKPGWALPEEATQTDEGIVTDSIQNGLKKPTTGGYERKVFAKQLARPIKEGKFVRNLSAKKPDPRMVWIVINVNGIKRGKIVMHLYGNADAIVDKFLELKGLEMERQNGMLVCKELEPYFHVFGGKVADLPKNNPSAVYGIVLEGQDVLQQAMNAAPDAVVSIKVRDFQDVLCAIPGYVVI